MARILSRVGASAKPGAIQFPASTEFYKELSAEAEKLQKDYATAAEKIDQQIDAWREALKAKITDPGKTAMSST
ncbi:hypothetical protein [Pseudomonas aeruginosa]|uniref:hypothetical protein n=1 Tax=Pseudomonas aeruginosa TaxID=287 RepID=UPI0023591384|nr:hypothetical protein [Pseudomonas aeruginosa]MDC9031710.1 hypothetical protein [Pseudomonas aeruginosa]